MIRAYQYNNIHEVKQMLVLHTILPRAYTITHSSSHYNTLHYNIHVHVATNPNQ